jgi:hypothetical protein
MLNTRIPCVRHTLPAMLLLTACATPDDTAVDPLDTAKLPRFDLAEVVEIGRDTDAEAQLLNRVTDAEFLGTDEFAVASDEGEILVFGTSGELHRRMGRQGEGPGEFRFIQDIVRLNDNGILAWDPAQDRVTAFAPDGRLDFTCTPTWAMSKQAGVGFVGAFPDGSFVLEDRSSRPSAQDTPSGLRSDTIPYLLFDRSGTLVRTLGQLIRHPRYYDANSGYQRFLFAPSVVSRIVGDELYVGATDSIILERFDTTGTARGTLRLERGPRRVTEQDIEAGWREREAQIAVAQEQLLVQMAATWGPEAAGASQERIDEAIARERETVQPAEFLPPYKSIIVASDGAVWLEEYMHPSEDITRWFLMNDDFLPVGWIELPPNERLLAAGPNRLIVLRKDELDVESVVVYER